MSNEARIEIVGNVARDPDLRQAAGRSVVGVTVLVTGRRKQGDEWVDGETVAYECTLWGDEAENAVASLPKGTAVLVVGRLVGVDVYESGGESRAKVKVKVESIGPSLKRATAQVSRRGGGFGPQPPAQPPRGEWAEQNGWATAQPGTGWGQ